MELNTLAMCPQYLELLNLGNMGAIDACTEKEIAISARTLHISNCCDGVLALEHTHHTLAIDIKQPNCNYERTIQDIE